MLFYFPYLRKNVSVGDLKRVITDVNNCGKVEKICIFDSKKRDHLYAYVSVSYDPELHSAFFKEKFDELTSEYQEQVRLQEKPTTYIKLNEEYYDNEAHIPYWWKLCTTTSENFDYQEQKYGRIRRSNRRQLTEPLKRSEQAGGGGGGGGGAGTEGPRAEGGAGTEGGGTITSLKEIHEELQQLRLRITELEGERQTMVGGILD